MCWLFGHKWHKLDNNGTFIFDNVCLRCAKGIGENKEFTISLEEAEFFRKLSSRYIDMGVEMRQIADLLNELYNDTCDTTKPNVYGTILGIHERIELFLESQKVFPIVNRQ